MHSVTSQFLMRSSRLFPLSRRNVPEILCFYYKYFHLQTAFYHRGRARKTIPVRPFFFPFCTLLLHQSKAFKSLIIMFTKTSALQREERQYRDSCIIMARSLPSRSYLLLLKSFALWMPDCNRCWRLCTLFFYYRLKFPSNVTSINLLNFMNL